MKLTHGEAYVIRRSNLDFTHDIDKILRSLERLPRRMPRKQALNYYGEKIRKYFGVDEIKPKDFLKVEHYFDYHEANRILHGKSKRSLPTSR